MAYPVLCAIAIEAHFGAVLRRLDDYESTLLESALRSRLSSVELAAAIVREYSRRSCVLALNSFPSSRVIGAYGVSYVCV